MRAELVVVLMLFHADGATSPPAGQTPAPAAQATGDRIAAAIWQHHRAIVLRATDPGEPAWDLKGFAPAIEFFERTTGIESETGTRLGRLPVPSLPATLRQWDAWYAKHRSRLYFDFDSCRVQMKED